MRPTNNTTRTTMRRRDREWFLVPRIFSLRMLSSEVFADLPIPLSHSFGAPSTCLPTLHSNGRYAKLLLHWPEHQRVHGFTGACCEITSSCGLHFPGNLCDNDFRRDAQSLVWPCMLTQINDILIEVIRHVYCNPSLLERNQCADAQITMFTLQHAFSDIDVIFHTFKLVHLFRSRRLTSPVC